MKVGYLASHYPAVSHTFVMREVAALRRRGVDVATLAIHAPDPAQLLTAADEREAASTFSVLPIGAAQLVGVHLRVFLRRPRRYLATAARAWSLSRPGLRGRLWQLFYLAETGVLFAHCEREGIRHIHAQFADVATDVALLVAELGGDGWTWSMAVHGPVEFYDVPGVRLAAKAASAEFVQTISHFGRSQVLTVLDEAQWDKVHVVRCGVDPAVYTIADDEHRPDDSVLRVLCVGRLVHIKGQSLLVEAVSALRDRGIDAHLVLVGDGPKRADLAALASRLGVADRVELLGSVGQDEVRRRLREADVFSLPSFAEGVPVVLMEAMALERPVVSTRIMGIPELVEHGTSGLLVAPGRLDELVDALAELASDPDRRERMGRAGRQRVLEEFDVNLSAERLERIFSGLST